MNWNLSGKSAGAGLSLLRGESFTRGRRLRPSTTTARFRTRNHGTRLPLSEKSSGEYREFQCQSKPSHPIPCFMILNCPCRLFTTLWVLRWKLQRTLPKYWRASKKGRGRFERHFLKLPCTFVSGFSTAVRRSVPLPRCSEDSET